MQVKKRNPKVNLPGHIKAWCVGDRQTRLIMCRAIDYSDKGRKKVAAIQAKTAPQTVTEDSGE
jgi:hypothetical protein